MKENIKTSFASAFEEDVYKGFTRFPKYLSSKYIYDSKGDKLFQDIMELEEYYLTGCEYNILKKHKAEISHSFKGKDGFDLIELGAGDGKKTKILLRYLSENNINFNYLPIDISENVLQELENSLHKELPKVNVKIQQGTYFKTLERLADFNNRKKVIMLLGSNIGNFLHEEAIEFLKNIQHAMTADDMLFMGFDQKKNPQTILNAYNDESGVTEAFNRNVLTRINRELDADFDINQFTHWEAYNPETGTAKSFLVSTKNQNVHINKLGLEVHFEAWESIHTEISQKYDDAIVQWLAKESGLKVMESFTDEKGYYKNYIFKRNLSKNS